MHLLSLAVICLQRPWHRVCFGWLSRKRWPGQGRSRCFCWGSQRHKPLCFCSWTHSSLAGLTQTHDETQVVGVFFFISCPSPSRHYSSSLTQQVLHLHLFGLIGPANSGLVSVSLFVDHVLHLLLSLRWCNVTTDASCYCAQGLST